MCASRHTFSEIFRLGGQMNNSTTIKYTSVLFTQISTIYSVLGKRTVILLTIAFLIITSSVILIDGWIRMFNNQTHNIISARNTLNNLNDLKYNVVRCESSQRGFLITDRVAYLTPFSSAFSDARKNMAQITTYYEDKSDEFQVEKKLKQSIISKLESKLVEMQTTIKLAQNDNKISALELINMDYGLHAMFTFNKEIDELIKILQKDIETRVMVRGDNTFYARCLIFLSSFIWLALVVTALKQMMKEMNAKEQLKLSLMQEKGICEKKLKNQNILVTKLALDYQQDVEKERQKLASELHDELGSIFTAIKMDVSWLVKKLKEPLTSASAHTLIEKLDKTTLYINKGITYHRHVIEQLNPTGLSNLGIWTTLRNLISDVSERNNWKLKLDLPDDNTQLNEGIGLIVYRLVQETLNNAGKYSKASVISVHIMMDEKYLKLEITDNGVGFDLTSQKSGKFGIVGMKNRISAIGGNFNITGIPGKGVSTLAMIPLKIDDTD